MAALFALKDRQVANDDDEPVRVSLDDLAKKLVECQANLARTKEELEDARLEFMEALQDRGVQVFDEE